jgi:hypothetical protein
VVTIYIYYIPTISGSGGKLWELIIGIADCWAKHLKTGLPGYQERIPVWFLSNSTSIWRFFSGEANRLENESDHSPQSSANRFHKTWVYTTTLTYVLVAWCRSTALQHNRENWLTKLIIEVPLILSKKMLNTALRQSTTLQVLWNSHLII